MTTPEWELTTRSFPLSHIFHLYSALPALNLRDLSRDRTAPSDCVLRTRGRRHMYLLTPGFFTLRNSLMGI